MKVALVEDETLIRVGIRKKVERLGAQVVYDTDNGYRLLEYMDREDVQQPDILFIDICMPILNGLETIEQVRRIRPLIPVVVLSGYHNFDYARQALRLGVHDYLLKPVDSEELKSTLHRIEIQLQEAQCESRERERQEAVGNLADFISCRGAVTLSRKTIRLLEDTYPGGFYVKLVLLSNWESHESWFGRVSEQGFSFIYPDRPNLLVALVEEQDKEVLKQQLKGVPFTAYYSQRQKEYVHLPYIVRKGIRAVKEYLMLERQVIIEQGKEPDDGEKIRQWESFYQSHYELLLRELEEHNLEEVKRQLVIIMQYPGITQNRRNQAWIGIAWKVCERLDIRDGIQDTAWLQEYDTQDSFTQGVVEALEQLIEESGRMDGPDQDKPVLEEILNYVQKNFTQDITLKGTSEQFYINRSHLARIFKRKTGTTFNNYLTDLRIEKACGLLEEGVPIGHVAELVGYDNSRYFSRVFCKVKGCTPSKYKEMKQEEAGRRKGNGT